MIKYDSLVTWWCIGRSGTRLDLLFVPPSWGLFSDLTASLLQQVDRSMVMGGVATSVAIQFLGTGQTKLQKMVVLILKVWYCLDLFGAFEPVKCMLNNCTNDPRRKKPRSWRLGFDLPLFFARNNHQVIQWSTPRMLVPWSCFAQRPAERALSPGSWISSTSEQHFGGAVVFSIHPRVWYFEDSHEELLMLMWWAKTRSK